MKSNYIFLKKNIESKSKIKKEKESITREDLIHPVYLMIESLFDKKSHDEFSIDIDNQEYCFNYKREKSSKGVYSFSLEVDYTQSVNAKILSKVHDRIIKGSHRSEHHIITSYSGASEYYCDKLYPLINSFERKLRLIVMFMVTFEHGEKWIENSFQDELIDALKSKEKSKLVENALYEMTIFQVEDYLFKKWRNIDSEVFLDNQLSALELKTLSKENIIELIENNKSYSLWERIFEDRINIVGLQKKLESIRVIRNKVAHSKIISYEDFNTYKNIFKDICLELDEAYNLLISNEELRNKVSITIDDLKAIYSFAKETGESLNISLDEVIRLVNSINIPLDYNCDNDM